LTHARPNSQTCVITEIDTWPVARSFINNKGLK
jgi:hypothetical protein